MKNHKKGFIVPLLIAIIAIVAITGGLYYFSQSKYADIKSDTTSADLVSTSSGQVNGAISQKDFLVLECTQKRYVNDKFGFSVDCPTDLKATVNDNGFSAPITSFDKTKTTIQSADISIGAYDQSCSKVVIDTSITENQNNAPTITFSGVGAVKLSHTFSGKNDNDQVDEYRNTYTESDGKCYVGHLHVHYTDAAYSLRNNNQSQTSQESIRKASALNSATGVAINNISNSILGRLMSTFGFNKDSAMLQKAALDMRKEPVVQTVNPDTSQWKIYSNATFGYQMSYPAGWKYAEVQPSLTKISEGDFGVHDMFSIQVMTNITESQYEQLLTAVKNNPIILSVDDKQTVDGHKAYKIVITDPKNQSDLTSGQFQERKVDYSVVYNGKLYTIEFLALYPLASTYQRNIDLLDKMVKTFKFTK